MTGYLVSLYWSTNVSSCNCARVFDWNQGTKFF